MQRAPNWKASGSHGFEVSDRLKEPAVFTFVWDTGGKGAVRNTFSIEVFYHSCLRNLKIIIVENKNARWLCLCEGKKDEVWKYF